MMLVVAGGPTQLAARLNLAGVVLVGGLDLLAVRAFSASARAGAADGGSYRLIQLLQLAALAGAFLAAYRLTALQWPGNSYAWVSAGLVLMVSGAAVRTWAIATLGPGFRRVVAIAEGQAVVDWGPYRWLRHPSYTGALASMAGLGVALDNALALALLLVLPVAGYLYRIRIEERVLMRGLPGYAEYARGRNRLVPGVW